MVAMAGAAMAAAAAVTAAMGMGPTLFSHMTNSSPRGGERGGILRWKYQLHEGFPLSSQAIFYNEDERPELFAYFVQGGTGQVLNNAHGNVYFGVANGTPCTMHSLALDDPEEECMAFQAIAKSTTGQMIDLPTPPDHIIIDVKPQAGTQWPKHLNLAPDSNFIRIPISLTSQCDKKAKVGTQESVTYYAHAVDLAFANTV